MQLSGRQLYYYILSYSFLSPNMERELLHSVVLIMILTLCASFIVIDAISYGNYERAHRILADNVNVSGGLINIDCGVSKDYMDDETGFWYQTDENFIETGESITIPGQAHSTLNYPYFGKRLQTLRCFPNGKRNCYTLRPKQGSNIKYMIRAFFSYGNYDGKNQTQSFDLYLGVNLLDTIDAYNQGYELAEYIHTPSVKSDSDIIQMCLVKTGETNPCISSLEFRPLNSSIYPVMSSDVASEGPQPLLDFEARIDVGCPSNGNIPTFSRYKDDIYDRMWRYDDINDNSWFRLEWDNPSENYDPRVSSDPYRLPFEVLKTASQSQNVSSPLNFDFSSQFSKLDMNSKYQVFFHLAEIKKLPNGKKRIIDRIALNSNYNILSQPLVLEYLKPITVSGYISNADSVNFSIIASPKSDAPPILNAFEIYKLIDQFDSPTDKRDVGAMMEIKEAYKITNKLSWQGDPCLPMQFRWEGLSCTSNTNPRITSLNLRSSNLKGVVNSSFSNLTELTFLDLSDNELEGPIPEFLAHLPKLEVLNLSANKFSGSIPKALREKTTLQLSVENNPDLCTTYSSCNNKKKNFTVPIIASISALIVILLISLGFWIFKRRQKVKAYRNFKKDGGALELNQQAFSYIEILNICENFKTVIGEGGFGKVYLGILQENVQVAVKLLSSTSVQGFREFRSEVQLLSHVRHRNLVSLLGYCDEGGITALIYEYMPNGNLQQHLSEKNPDVLKWKERLTIAIDLVTGLDYLHNGCQPPIVHRDLKTSNVLLDQSKHAKIADFGLSRAFDNDIHSHISTRPAGTPGYIDPEFHRTGNCNKKSDVYSIGIILLELISGKPAIVRIRDNNQEVIHIIQWVTPLIEIGDIESIVDPRLQGKFNPSSAWRIVEIALSCCSVSSQRPDINQILVELKECLYVKIDNNIDPGMSVQLEITEFPLSPR